MDGGVHRGGGREAAGGIRAHESVKAAAIAQIYGVDGMALLRSHDPVEVMIQQALVESAVKAQQELDQTRANMNANAIGQVLAKMFRK